MQEMIFAGGIGYLITGSWGGFFAFLVVSYALGFLYHLWAGFNQ